MGHLKSIILVESQREINEKISFETHYYLSDLAFDPKIFNTYIRNHWSIENKLHRQTTPWKLDVVFREDLQKRKLEMLLKT